MVTVIEDPRIVEPVVRSVRAHERAGTHDVVRYDFRAEGAPILKVASGVEEAAGAQAPQGGSRQP